MKSEQYSTIIDDIEVIIDYSAGEYGADVDGNRGISALFINDIKILGDLTSNELSSLKNQTISELVENGGYYGYSIFLSNNVNL